MKLEIESTDSILSVDGTPCRLWVGRTPDGTPCHVLVALVGVRSDLDQSKFADLLDCEPSEHDDRVLSAALRARDAGERE